MKCSICHKEVVLVPSAAQRARKYGDHSAAYYTKLFPYHGACAIAKRNDEVRALIASKEA